jgi:hypothetical protein
MLLCASLAFARPTEGGSWSFDESDVVTSLDSPEGLVRVWYSTSGPNVVKDRDDDGNGRPDFAENVGTTSEEVLLNLETHGFRLPLSDEGKGGSDALDAYLVDFAGNADGMWTSESCDGKTGPCSGYFTMENDFSGYGYSNVEAAVSILTSHELFHGVQAAYAQTDEVWFLEGTAVWAEHLFDPYNEDFVWFCSAYLTDTGRPIYEPPSGPVPEFAYATGLWWWFLADRYGDEAIVELMEGFADAPDQEGILAAMSAVEAAHGGTLAQDFTDFGRLNLATGERAGAMSGGYPFAADLTEVTPEADGASIVDDNRFYPLATTYYRLEWAGGELWFAADEAGDDLVASVHAIDDEGRALDALATPTVGTEAQSLGELEAGEYWLVVGNPTLAEDSTKLTVCLGSKDDIAVCAPPADSAGDTSAVPDTGEGATEDSGAKSATPEGCGCDSASGLGAAATLFSLLALRRRRRVCA